MYHIHCFLNLFFIQGKYCLSRSGSCPLGGRCTIFHLDLLLHNTRLRVILEKGHREPDLSSTLVLEQFAIELIILRLDPSFAVVECRFSFGVLRLMVLHLLRGFSFKRFDLAD